MTPAPRRARLRALAKINASLKVLHKRADGFHEIRTIFQTISLGDTIEAEFTPGTRTRIELDSSLEIADNLVSRAAEATLDALRVRGHARLQLSKRIPLRAGLGGGSSDAAAILLGLPVLAGAELVPERLLEIAGELGSDVPFFLLGGAALGIGRGTELYPLPEPPALSGILVTPGVEISTREAYGALGRTLTAGSQSTNIMRFQVLSRSWGRRLSPAEWSVFAENDFEGYAFERYPEVAAVRRELLSAGASPVLLSGSGSSVFGIFPDREERDQVLSRLRHMAAEPFEFVSRARYRRMWRKSLQEHMRGDTWPLQSR